MAAYNSDIVHSPMELRGLAKYLSLVFHRRLECAIWSFCDLGIADLMADHQVPITALELSQLNGNNWNAQFLYRLLRVIADADIIREIKTNNGNSHENNHLEDTIQYQLTEDGLFLTSNHFSKASDAMRATLDPNDQGTAYFPSLIKDGYKNGNSVEQTSGCTFFEYMKKEENKEVTSLFNSLMIFYTNYTATSTISVIDFTRFDKLVDIGGGLGTLLSFVLEKHKNLHGILFDLEHVIENAKTINPNEFQRKQIESNRYDFVVGDMFKSETIPPADVYMLKFIIHDWNDEKSMKILKSIRDANKTQTEKIITVFIIERVILSNDKDNWEAHLTDLEMLTLLSSKERTLSEYINILNKSGYEMKQFYRAKSMSIIEAVTTT